MKFVHFNQFARQQATNAAARAKSVAQDPPPPKKNKKKNKSPASYIYWQCGPHSCNICGNTVLIALRHWLALQLFFLFLLLFAQCSATKALPTTCAMNEAHTAKLKRCAHAQLRLICKLICIVNLRYLLDQSRYSVCVQPLFASIQIYIYIYYICT